MGKNLIKKLNNKVNEVNKLILRVGEHHTGAYAAQSAFFFILSLIPIILLMLTMVQFTPVTKADVMTGVMKLFPKSVNGMLVSIVNQVYNTSRTIIPVTIIVALWSAGKGVLGLTTGMNCIYGCPETRNYLLLRFRATFYTVLFIVVIVLSLVLSVFGNRISLLVYAHAKFLTKITDFLMETRTFFSLVVLTLFWGVVYTFLPNRKIKMRTQFIGAFITSCGWLLISWIFSVYLDIFTGFTDMYGSLTTIVLIMMWLYFCMYITLLGSELNVMLMEHQEKEADCEV
ncbi:MAG: YihY/virulence factor BrkB family protein [Hespellia sp.]|nr:YihY/virulence factor BrkB family protein [Hespellia sp.]